MHFPNFIFVYYQQV